MEEDFFFFFCLHVRACARGRKKRAETGRRVEKMKEARKRRKEEREAATDRGEERRWKREMAVEKNSLTSARARL